MCSEKWPSRFDGDTVFRELWDRLWSICFPFGDLNKTVTPNYVQQDYKSPKNKFLSNLHPPKARQFLKMANNCMACWLSVHSLYFFFSSSPILSIFLFCPLLRLSTPPLNRTIFSACYRAWSIPCYHREINYLDQAAGERGNNERMLLLRRR